MKKATTKTMRRLKFNYARPSSSKRWHLVTPWNGRRTFCDMSFTTEEVSRGRLADDIPADAQGCNKCTRAAAEFAGNLSNHVSNLRGPRLYNPSAD